MGELIFELVLPAIGRFIVFLLVELLFQTIFYFTGYPIVKMLTLGVYLLDVKSIYVRDDLYKDGVIDQQDIDVVGKLGSDWFSLPSEKVELLRP
ncbi:hypothetical protein P4S70_15835 [Enterovibrio sp. Hal110]